MEIQIRPCRPDDFSDFCRTTAAAFGDEISDDDIARIKRLEGIDRALCAVEGDDIVGTTSALSFEVTVPGAELPAAGVTAVGVLPTHRRRGILSQLMRRQLADIHERGEPLAMLWASEGSIYRRYGYGLATIQGEIDILRDRATFRRPPAPFGHARLVDVEEAALVLPVVFDQVRVKTPGMFTRSPLWWRESRLADPPDSRHGGSAMFRVVIENEGAPVAYALYRLYREWSKGVPSGSLEVLEVLSTCPDATVELWRFLFGVDLVARVRSTWLPADHPLLQLVAEPARLHLKLQDAIWLRIIDLAHALQERSYARDGALVLGVTDALCGWNEGVWRLDAHAGGSSVEPTATKPDIALDIEDLSSVYLGGFTFTHLYEAGRLRSSNPEAIRRGDELFRTERAPFCSENF